MTYAVPTPDQLADIQASELEQSLRLDRDGNSRLIDARSPRSVFAALSRANAMALYGTHLHLRWLADQVFPDTCDDENMLARHGSLWGIARRAASFAIGFVQFSGSSGTVLPSGLVLTLSGKQWMTTAAGTLDDTGNATLPVQAVTAGVAGNMPSQTILVVQTPVVGLSAQTVIVADGGLTGGADIESVESWRGRIIQRIRTPAHGGAAFDYIEWAKESMPVARVSCLPNWLGMGTVGIPFVMADEASGVMRAPTDAEIASMTSALSALAPVTAHIVPFAATLTQVDIAVQVNPNKIAVISAVSQAIANFFSSPDRNIGSPLHLSMLSDAISLAAGEAWHRIVSPSNDIVAGPNELLVAGSINIVGATS